MVYVVNFVEHHSAISVDRFKKKGSEMFFLDSWWWGVYDIFRGWHVIAIVTDILPNELTPSFTWRFNQI